MNNLKFKMIYVPLTLMMILGIVMIGITDFIALDFDPEVFKTASFWSNIICTNVGILCLILSIVLMRNDKFKQENIEYISSDNNINTFYRKEFIAPIFKKFMYDYNLNTKIATYKLKINKKFTKVKPTEDDLKIYYGEDEQAKQENKYCKAVVYYEQVLSDDYIQKFVPKLYIKYNAITEGLIFTGVAVNDTGLDFITKHKGLKIFKDLFPKFLLSFSMVMLLSSIFPDAQEGITGALIFKTIGKLFTVVSQIYFAYNYSDKYNVEVTLHDVRFRESVLNEYNLWMRHKTDFNPQRKRNEEVINNG